MLMKLTPEDCQVCIVVHGHGVVTPSLLEFLPSSTVEVVNNYVIGGWQMSNCVMTQEIEQAHGWSKVEYNG